MEIRSNEIESILLFEKSFFDPENVIKNLRRDFHNMKKQVEKGEIDKVMKKVEMLIIIVVNQEYNKRLEMEVLLYFCKVLISFADISSDYKVLKIALRILNNEKNKALMANWYSYEYKCNKAFALLRLFNASNRGNISNKITLKFDNTKLLIESKYLLLKIYIGFIEDKIKITNEQLIECLSMLSVTLSQLARWPESYTYIKKISELTTKPVQVEYFEASFLDEMKNQTCMSSNGMLILKIIDTCKLALKQKKELLGEQVVQVQEILKSNNATLKLHNIDIKKLRDHKKNLSTGQKRN